MPNETVVKTLDNRRFLGVLAVAEIGTGCFVTVTGSGGIVEMAQLAQLKEPVWLRNIGIPAGGV